MYLPFFMLAVMPYFEMMVAFIFLVLNLKNVILLFCNTLYKDCFEGSYASLST